MDDHLTAALSHKLNKRKKGKTTKEMAVYLNVFHPSFILLHLKNLQ